MNEIPGFPFLRKSPPKGKLRTRLDCPHPANTPTHEAMPLDERHHFFILHDRHGWQSPEQLQDLRAVAYGTTCQFADNKRMAVNFGAMKKRDEPELAMAQMLHPDRGVDKHQRLAIEA